MGGGMSYVKSFILLIFQTTFENIAYFWERILFLTTSEGDELHPGHVLQKVGSSFDR